MREFNPGMRPDTHRVPIIPTASTLASAQEVDIRFILYCILCNDRGHLSMSEHRRGGFPKKITVPLQRGGRIDPSKPSVMEGVPHPQLQAHQELQTSAIFPLITGLSPNSRSDPPAEPQLPIPLVKTLTVGASATCTSAEVRAARLRLAMGFKTRAAITITTEITCECIVSGRAESGPWSLQNIKGQLGTETAKGTDAKTSNISLKARDRIRKTAPAIFTAMDDMERPLTSLRL